MKNIDCKNNLEFISGILIANTVKIEMILTEYRNIYETLKINPNHNVSSMDIEKISLLLISLKSYKNLVYSYPEECNAIPWIEVKNFNKNAFTKLCIGKSVNNINEFAAFISFMKYYSSRYTNLHLIICADENKGKENETEYLNFYMANIGNFINLFIKTYEKEKERLNDIENYINLIDEYKENPTLETYNRLIFKASSIKGIPSIDICSLKTMLNNSFENKLGDKPYQFSLEAKSSSREERKKAHEKSYADEEPETLKGKSLKQLDELYDFLCQALDNKEDYKIISADLPSFFENIEPGTISAVIDNLIYKLNKNGNLNNERVKTVVKRLGEIK